jgi:hypothetical protein
MDCVSESGTVFLGNSVFLRAKDSIGEELENNSFLRYAKESKPLLIEDWQRGVFILLSNNQTIELTSYLA